MSEVVTVELEAKTDKAEANLNDVVDALKDIKSELGENKKAIEKNADSTKELESNFKKVAKSVKGFGLALKAAGVGLAIEAFSLFKEVVGQNQTVIDAFSTGMEALTTAFNDLFNFIADNIGTVTGFFKDIFENPKENLIAFGDAIKNNLIERFNSFLDTLGYLATAVKKVFEGDFAGALEATKSAAKESFDVFTGVNNVVDKVGEAVTNTTNALIDYTKSTFEAAAATVELNKEAQLAAVINQGLIEKYDRQAEQQRQIRDDETLSIEKRIEANEKLGEILDLQEKEMLANAKSAEDAALRNLAKDKDNLDFQIAYQQALNESAAIEAQIEGFRSEQLVNRNSLLREQQQLVQEGIDAEQKALEERKKKEEEFTKFVLEQEAARKKSREQLTLSGANTLLAINNSFEAKTEQQRKKAFERDKALKIALATIDTYQGASSAYAAAVGGPIIKALAAAAAVASGLARVAQIKKQTFNSTNTSAAAPISISSGSGFNGGNNTPTGNINPFGNTINAIPQFTNTATGNNQAGVRAYVIENEITNQQALAKRLDQRATL